MRVLRRKRIFDLCFRARKERRVAARRERELRVEGWWSNVPNTCGGTRSRGELCEEDKKVLVLGDVETLGFT